jgi:hypothetical protein
MRADGILYGKLISKMQLRSLSAGKWKNLEHNER